jgi:site-specific DNA-methyltransferase (adenine-specific)
MVCAIEDAGFEIRDMVEWVYGSGFPKSYDIGKGIDKQAGAEREVVGEYISPENTSGGKGRKFCHGGQPLDGLPKITAPSTPEAQLWDGWGTALKPAHEPIVVAMKPIDGNFVNNALTWGVAGYWIDGGRVETSDKLNGGCMNGNVSASDGWDRPWRRDEIASKNKVERYKEQVKKGETIGRFPANLIHDGSDEVLEVFPDVKTGNKSMGRQFKGWTSQGELKPLEKPYNGGDSGSASRFFYCAKASRAERNAGLEGMEKRRVNKLNSYGNQDNYECPDGAHRVGDKGSAKMQNHHPTVKPIALMRYLVRLTNTPTGGVVLDPFMGSGTTGIACELEGRDFVGIEREPEYIEIAEKRIAHYALPIFEDVNANTD